MPLQHDFYLVNRSEQAYGDYSQFINAPNAIHLHDDLIGYLWDTLVWIPALNPPKQEPCQGLCRWGVTVITREGAPVARTLFERWAAQFSCGPAELDLCGGWCWTEGEAPESGRYDRIRADLDQLVLTLQQLAAFAEQIELSTDDLYLLHIGI